MHVKELAQGGYLVKRGCRTGPLESGEGEEWPES